MYVGSWRCIENPGFGGRGRHSGPSSRSRFDVVPSSCRVRLSVRRDEVDQGRRQIIPYPQMKHGFTSSMWKLLRVGWELFISTYGSTLVAAELMYLFYPLAQLLDANLSFHQFNRVLSLPYFPIQIATGFTIGYLGRSRLGTRFSSWLWIVPFCNLTWHFLTFTPSVFANRWLSRLDHFMGFACQLPCSDHLIYTAPLYASMAYGLGAYAKRRLGTTGRPSAQP